ncbi:MAG: DUF523 domain-containing protein [Candidatus Sumerlaeota bacterium]|nr:DUF523 domain-containing protein [Candidatus Sumerlaeota bacterium]
MKLVSACLVGLCANYRGEACAVESLQQAFARGEVIPVCPEQLGGLPTPRPPAEVFGGTAEDVLSGKARVIQCDGTDVTDAFLRGAREVLKLARLVQPELIIFKENSPSCGVNSVYDGTHSRRLIAGCGVTTALLRQHGFKVISEKDIPS